MATTKLVAARSLAVALLVSLAGCGTDSGGSASGTAGTPGPGPVRIGMLTPLSGPFTPLGVQVRAGMRLAVDEVNASGGIDGRRVEIVAADTRNDPGEATTALERMVEQDGVVAVGGIISSDVGLATARTAEELEVPLFLVKSGAGDVLTRDSRFTFRTCLPAAPMVAMPIRQLVRREGLSRVGAIVADYAWGRSVADALEGALGDLDAVTLDVEVAPLDADDLTPYVRGLDDPDLIVATGHPPAAGPITLQATGLGLGARVVGPWNPFSLIHEQVGDAAIDVYTDFGCVDFAAADYQELAARLVAGTDQVFMENEAVAGYGHVTMVAEAVAEVGDDPAAIAGYLHGHTFDLPGYAHTMAWTEWGELAESQPVFAIMRRRPPPEGINPGADWYPEVLLVSDPLEPYTPE